MIDTLFRWRGFGDGFGTWESLCRLRIYEAPERAVVIATELPENTGTSITNAAEHLATLVVEQYELRPQTLVWIEHYPARLWDRRRGGLVGAAHAPATAAMPDTAQEG